MEENNIKDLYDKYIIGCYTKKPIAIIKGKGCWVWDSGGKKYLDMFAGWGVNILGHCHPAVVKAIKNQSKKLLHVANDYYNEQQAQLAKIIISKSFKGKCFFCNSGAEANEAAIKLARISSGGKKYKIITMKNSFHGRTLATITATGQKKYQQGFSPLPTGFKYANFNDIEDVEKIVDDKVSAIMLELIQGEGGVNVASKEFIVSLRKLCNERGILLIFDEVQTGIGRTGKYFAYEHYGIEPDIMTLAKGIAGGLSMGAMVSGEHLANALKPGTHASTFGGNPLACASAIAVFDVINKENCLKNAESIGKYIIDKVKKFSIENNRIKDIRGKGCMIGIELVEDGDKYVSSCREKGLLINCTHRNVLRFYPHLTVEKEEVDKALNILFDVLSD